MVDHNELYLFIALEAWITFHWRYIEAWGKKHAKLGEIQTKLINTKINSDWVSVDRNKCLISNPDLDIGCK